MNALEYSTLQQMSQYWLMVQLFEGLKEQFLLKVEIAVDKDRSGTENDPGIQFGGADKTAEDDPYVFWVNNDYDEGSDDEALDNEPTRGDYLDGQISNTRDLEDFSRLWLNVGSILTQLKDGTMRLGLDWQGCTNTLCIYA